MPIQVAYGEGQIPAWNDLRVLTDFAASAKSWAELLHCKLEILPFPQYYVLYNGEKDEEDQRSMDLKDAFPTWKGIEPCLNCTATLLNINYGHNAAVMKRSKSLRDYSVYIQRIRDHKASGMDISQAVDKATEECIMEGILRDVLLKNSAEVKNMVLGIWGTENHIRKQQEEQLETGYMKPKEKEREREMEEVLSLASKCI